VIKYVLMFLLFTDCASKITPTNPVITETPKYGFTVAKTKGIDGIDFLDREFDEFKECIERRTERIIEPERLKRYTIILLTSSWKCKYHTFGCNGEVRSSPPQMWLNVYAEGIFGHELAHVYSFLNSKDRYLDERVKGCFRCKSCK
jgi:hypothetical protein